ncbi:hypothetical protein V2I01_12430 [Micromonospora sp. BRA006-A]|nr:hypothetical protein [Micromonospora sp. BRA006-A]
MAARWGTRTRRAVATPAAALIVLAELTACSPEIKGVTGLTVDAHGRPHAALAWCADRPPDLVVLTSVAESASPGAPTPEGRTGRDGSTSAARRGDARPRTP